jgi:Domain of unknown function (DUF4956)
VSTAMSLLAGLASDLAAIALLAYAVYFRRYHRRDLLLAYVALNVGVLAVTVLLAGAQAGIGLGLACSASCRSSGEVRHVVVLEVDMVRDVTVVDVRFRTARLHHELRMDSASRHERAS